METKKVLYPGSFDPITKGHMNIIDKAVKFFGNVVVAVMQNNSKGEGMFTLFERAQMIRDIYKDNPHVTVIYEYSKKATVDVALENDCVGIIRGLRNVTDYEQEVQMSRINKVISNGKVETLMLVADIEVQDISSSLVKELFYLNKDISKFVHPIVLTKMYLIK